MVLIGIAGFMIYQALSSSLVYFILPSEYAASPHEFDGRRVRLGGIVETGSVGYDQQELQLTFLVTDSFQSYPVRHRGTPPELFQENIGVVIEGNFKDGVFVSDNLLIKHSEVYRPPEEGHVDLNMLKESLQ